MGWLRVEGGGEDELGETLRPCLKRVALATIETSWAPTLTEDNPKKRDG